MRLTTKGRFAVTAMLDLALNASDGPVTLANIAARQKISLSYLEQLFAKLRRNDLVASVRGPGGGYQLARSSDQLSVAEIIIAVEESIDSRQCEGKKDCLGEGAGHRRCMTHDLWESLNQNVIQFLSAVTLAELVQQQFTPTEPATKTVSGPASRVKSRQEDTNKRRASFAAENVVAS